MLTRRCRRIRGMLTRRCRRIRIAESFDENMQSTANVIPALIVHHSALIDPACVLRLDGVKKRWPEITPMCRSHVGWAWGLVFMYILWFQRFHQGVVSGASSCRGASCASFARSGRLLGLLGGWQCPPIFAILSVHRFRQSERTEWTSGLIGILET